MARSVRPEAVQHWGCDACVHDCAGTIAHSAYCPKLSLLSCPYRNSHNVQQFTVDLHGLHVEEALQYTCTFLEQGWGFCLATKRMHSFCSCLSCCSAA